MNRITQETRQHQSGWSYVEVLVSMIILGTALVPAIDALRVSYVGISASESLFFWEQAAASRLESVLSEPYASLESAATAAGNESTPTGFSDIAGTTDRVLVYLSAYDADDADGDGNPFTGTDAGVLWVNVTIEDTSVTLATLVLQ